MEVESKELRERQDEQPNVIDDTSSGSGPDKGLDVSTLSFMLSRPMQPKVLHGVALENDGEQEADVVDDVEGHGPDKNAAELVVRREHAQVEENNGRSDKEAGDGVQQHVGEE